MILRVFIVEDEEMIRKGLVYTVDWSAMNCMVAGSAADGREGLNGILEKKPDVVITDIRMPEMDGLEMLEEAAKICSFRSILLTSYTDFEYARRAVSLRAYDYLLKPLDEDHLEKLMLRIHEEEEKNRQVNRLLPLLQSECRPASLMLDELRAQDDYVDIALQRIADDSTQHLSIEGIADELGVSASYLSRRFKAVTGQTFLDTLNMQRIQKAVGLLHEGVRTAAVAERTGFSDYKHFCAVFKRCTGLTPREFLRVHY